MDITSPSIPQAVTEQMWREVIAQLRAFVRRRIADPERAEDLVGEILLRIHQNLGSVDDRERLTHWVSPGRAQCGHRRVPPRRPGPRTPRRRHPRTPSPSTVGRSGRRVGRADELSRCLRPLLDGLPAEQRRAVEMIDLDGLPQAGAARREGVSLSGMKSRVQRGRRRLAELLEPVLHAHPRRPRRAHGLRTLTGLRGGCGCS